MEGGKHEKKYVEFVFSLVNTSCVYIIICKSSPLYSLPPPPSDWSSKMEEPREKKEKDTRPRFYSQLIRWDLIDIFFSFCFVFFLLLGGGWINIEYQFNSSWIWLIGWRWRRFFRFDCSFFMGDSSVVVQCLLNVLHLWLQFRPSAMNWFVQQK